MNTGYRRRCAINSEKETKRLAEQLRWLEKLLKLFKKLGHIPTEKEVKDEQE